MAASGATPIQLYYSTTASTVPTAANLLPGELGLNIADMKLYCENSSGVVTLLASAAGAAGDAVLASNNAFTGANTFYNATGQTFAQASTNDGIIVKGRAGGSSSYAATITPPTLAANITLTLPASTGTLLTSTSPLAIAGNSSAGAEIRLPEDTDNGTNYVAIKAPDSLSADFTCTLPDETCTLGFRNIPQNSQSTAYTLVLTDSGKHILHPSADTTARTFTIPANSSVAYPVGTAIMFVNQNGAGTVTIAITTDTMRLAGTGNTGSRTLAANGVATCIKLTSTEWIISGTGLT